MPAHPVATAHRLLAEAVDALTAAVDGGGATDTELLSVLTLNEGMARRLDRLTVAAVAVLERRGAFAERGYASPAAALGDLLGWERFEARRRVTAAEQVQPRLGLDGSPLPARLPATAEVFAAGRAGLRHVEVIAKVLATPAAGRLSPQVWGGAEAELAAKADQYTPSELQAWGTALIDALDEDGPAPDDQPPPLVNELTVTAFKGKPGGQRSRADSRIQRCSTRSPPWWTPSPSRSPPTTRAPPGSGRPKPSPTRARSCSNTATCPQRGG